jgi:two-component system chemotaxis response regulator CheY
MQGISYYRCGDCGKIVADDQAVLANPAAASPCCGSSGSARSIWPQPAVYVLFDTAARQELSLPGSFSIAVVFLHAALAVLAENTAAQLLVAQGASPEEIDQALREYPGIDVLAALLKKQPSPGAAALPAACQKHIAALHQLRRLVARDATYRPQAADKETVAWVRDHSLAAFAELQNQQPAGTRARYQTILIVDDELAVLAYMKKLAERLGARAYTAATGTDAVLSYQAHKPSLVFLDVSLPDLDGMSVLKKIKEIDPAAVVYLVTAIGGEAFVHAAEKLGAKGYLPKPVSHNDLAAIIQGD